MEEFWAQGDKVQSREIIKSHMSSRVPAGEGGRPGHISHVRQGDNQRREVPGGIHQLHSAAPLGDLGRARLPRHQLHPRHSEEQQVRNFSQSKRINPTFSDLITRNYYTRVEAFKTFWNIFCSHFAGQNVALFNCK